MRVRRIPLAAALAASLALPFAQAARDGGDVYRDVCAACHASGRDGAPRVGDAKAWSARSAKGLSSLSDTAIAGVRKMPPHGGKLDLGDLEIRRAITYMVNESGGRWTEPIDRRSPPKARSGAEIVKAQCVKCHGEGVGGAPRIGDDKAWVGRAREGFDSLVQSVIRGHGAMPARGGMADLTDTETRAAVAYLFQESVRPVQKGK
jgi:cytochrome c5